MQMHMDFNDSIPTEGYAVRPVSYAEAKAIVVKHHYTGKMPCAQYNFGLYRDGDLAGVITYGPPVTRNARRGLCGEDYELDVLELNRLALVDNRKNEASMLISRSLKLLPQGKVIVSFADRDGQGHEGTIYRASNFLYTGLSAKRTDYKIEGLDADTHNMTICDKYRGIPNRVAKMREDYGDRLTMVQRPRKHRYVTFIGSKGFRARALKALRYAVSTYPKVDSPSSPI